MGMPPTRHLILYRTHNQALSNIGRYTKKVLQPFVKRLKYLFPYLILLSEPLVYPSPEQ